VPAVHEQELKKKLEEIWQSGGAGRKALREELVDVISVDLSNMVDSARCVFYHKPTDTLVLGCRTKEGYNVVLTSSDKGETWREVYRDPRVLGGIHSGIITRAGTLLLGSFGGSGGLPCIYRSEDLETFTRVWEGWEIPHGGDVLKFAEDTKGNIYCSAICTEAPRIHFLKSSDDGKTWREVGTYDDDHVHDIRYDKWNDRFIIITGDTVYATLETKDFETFTTLRTGKDYTAVEFLSGAVILCMENHWISINPSDLSWEKTITSVRRQLAYRSSDASVASIAEPATYITFGFFWAGNLLTLVGWDSGYLWFSTDIRNWNRINLGDSIRWVASDESYVYATGGKTFFRLRKAYLSNLRLTSPPVGEYWVFGWDGIEIRDTNTHYSDNFEMCDYDKAVIQVINELDQDVTLQVEGNWHPAFYDKVNVGSPFTVSTGSRDYQTVTDPFPYMRVAATAAATPSSGRLRVVVFLVRSV